MEEKLMGQCPVNWGMDMEVYLDTVLMNGQICIMSASYFVYLKSSNL